MTQLPQYWYSVVAALPDPEVDEHVSVALVVGAGRIVRVHYFPELPRLSPFVPEGKLRLFRSTLARLEKTIRDPEDVLAAAAQLGPHFRVSRTRELYEPPTGRVLKILQNQFLRRSVTSPRRSRKSVQRQASQRLDAAVEHKLPFEARWEKTATAKNLYPEVDLKRVFAAPVPPLNRAVRIGNYDVLIGSVVIEGKDPLNDSRDAAARISQAFWQYTQARDTLRKGTDREIRTLGVVLNGSGGPQVSDAKEYVHHLWNEDVDDIVLPDVPDQEGGIIEAIKKLVSQKS